jgi:hypothetical protein
MIKRRKRNLVLEEGGGDGDDSSNSDVSSLSSITTIEFWYSIPTIIILIGIQSGHNYCRNTVGL